MVDIPPFEQLLRQAGARLELGDLTGLSGIEGLKFRHARNRHPNYEEMSCISLVFVGDAPHEDEQFRSQWEQVRYLEFDLQADVYLPTEDEQDPAKRDVTGMLTPGRALAAAVQILFESDLVPNWCDAITSGSIDPDETSKPDKARMARRLQMQYRVRTDNPNVLLAQGAIEP